MTSSSRGCSFDFFQGKRVFITGHTGFKGSWLTFWLRRLGSEIAGFALEPHTNPSMFQALDVRGDLSEHHVGDVRERRALENAMSGFAPQVVFHLAAQPLVRESYEDPVGTFATNVMGTVHCLEAVRKLDCVQAVIIVTTDKVYRNQEWEWGYREIDALGGKDPYSGSKAACELAVDAYRHSYFACAPKSGPVILSARAGNVIGGGDWSKDRLIPDAVRAIAEGMPVGLRNPGSIRPWQHVIEPLAGYMMLAMYAVQRGGLSQAYNFGPAESEQADVEAVISMFCESWQGSASYENLRSTGEPVHESRILKLDAGKARADLGWEPRLGLPETIAMTVEWYRAFYQGAQAQELRALTGRQIAHYTGEAQ
ncbi:MAG: CDP-glucose 4,6-dehydratase [Myxococcota bacterium]|nr:CDP-glucose 4,6-dehydratase [Myxococcota bacterium]